MSLAASAVTQGECIGEGMSSDLANMQIDIAVPLHQLQSCPPQNNKLPSRPWV